LKRLAKIALFASALCVTAPVPQAVAQQLQVLNLQDADIRVFIQDVARTTGQTFIIDPRVQGRVSLASQTPLARDELFEVLLSTLRANGLVAAPAGSRTWRIEPAAAGQGGAVQAAGFATQIFKLRSLDARSAAETLRPMISAQGAVVPSQRGNLLIVADYADNLRRVRSLLAQVDQDRGVTQTVTLRSSSAREIARVLNELLAGPGGDPGARNGLVSIVVVDSSNSIVLKGEPDVVRPLLEVIADLDRRAESAGDVRVVQLQHADAEQLLPVLQQLVGQSPAPAAAPASAGADGEGPAATAPVASSPAGARANIARYPGANAIIIAADPETQRMLAEVIRQLDLRRQQVLVEAIVVEVSDETAKRLGVQFAIAGINGSNIPFAATNYANTAPNLPALIGAAAGEGQLPENSPTLDILRNAAVSSLLGANGIVTGGGGTLNDDALFGVIINAVKSDTASNLLSTPSIMTLDNQEATLLAGQEVPITTGEVLGDDNSNPFRTIQRQNVGVALEVKPQINAGGTVTLFLRQEVSSVAGPVSANFTELILNKREITTTVNVDDGDIVVLGGLLDQNERVSVERTPVLGDVPVLGHLFRGTNKQRTKTNLMVFIRPTIVRDASEARALTGPRFGYISDRQPRRDAGAQSDLEALVRHYMGATPPNALPAPDPSTPAPAAPVPSLQAPE
jgi:general secretion pathway protein D